MVLEKSDALPYGNNRCGSRNKLIFSILCPSSQRQRRSDPSLSSLLALLGGGGSLL
jgi:hypothetical protein